MSKKLAPLRGMKDIYSEDYDIHKYIEKTALDTAKLYGYNGISTPIMESINVFDRTLGATSDVVSKEIYCFCDKKGRKIALRPEFTAGVIRAFVSEGMKHKIPLKLFSSGPLFRYDRPQEGRQRQFHQVNFEYIGAKSPYCDAETISMASHILNKLGVLNDTRLELNSLGDDDSKISYQSALVEYFDKYFSDLSEESKKRIKHNPLRILDSKDENDKKISENAPIFSEYYSKYSYEYFESVKNWLDNLGVSYHVNPRLVRGLDYYSHTAFEFITDKLGAQSTISAGGRYDNLGKLMGDSVIPAIGFACGIERIALMKNFEIKKENFVNIISIGSECHNYSVKILDNLRKINIPAKIKFDGKLSKNISSAISENAKFILIIGNDEMKKNIVKLKDVDAKSEEEIPQSKIIKLIAEKMS